jgi:hypothetical protein
VKNLNRFEFNTAFLKIHYTWHLPAIAPSYEGTVLNSVANVGYFTLFTASGFPQRKIVRVEPLPSNLAILNNVIATNALRQCSC